jgi:hypothetical protein
MANELFKNFPKIGYRLENGKYVTIRDFFRKSTVEQSYVNNIIDYEYYELQDGERPDIVATKIYGNGDLHWTLFLVNEFLNYNDWHKDTETFDTYMKEKYPGHYLTVTNLSDLIDQDKKFLLGEKISTPVGHGRVLQLQPTYKRLGVTNSTKWRTGDVITGEVSGKSFEIENVIEMKDGVSHYVNSDGLKKNYFENGYTSVSLIEHEMEHNEEKRKIKIIRPELINRVVNEFERLMSN